MTDNMEKALRALAEAPAHPRLGSIEAEVLDRIGRDPPPYLAGMSIFGAAFLALAIGFAGGLFPRAASGSGETLAPLAASSPLAPSSLLASSE